MNHILVVIKKSLYTHNTRDVHWAPKILTFAVKTSAISQRWCQIIISTDIVEFEARYYQETKSRVLLLINILFSVWSCWFEIFFYS